jgi:hypothetical protein
VTARDTLLHWGLSGREADDVLAEHDAEVRNGIEAELYALHDVPLPAYLRGTFNAGTYGQAWRWCRAVVRGEHPKPYDLNVTDPRAAAALREQLAATQTTEPEDGDQ